MFTAKKSGKHKETRRKYKYTLDRLQAWAVRNGRHYLANITESDLEKYQSSWTLKSNYAKRNEQERLRTFFRYCCASAEIRLSYNPTAQLEHFNVTSDEPENPYTKEEYAAIVDATHGRFDKPEVPMFVYCNTKPSSSAVNEKKNTTSTLATPSHLIMSPTILSATCTLTSKRRTSRPRRYVHRRDVTMKTRPSSALRR
jgi:hypothetical protein